MPFPSRAGVKELSHMPRWGGLRWAGQAQTQAVQACDLGTDRLGGAQVLFPQTENLKVGCGAWQPSPLTGDFLQRPAGPENQQGCPRPQIPESAARTHWCKTAETKDCSPKPTFCPLFHHGVSAPPAPGQVQGSLQPRTHCPVLLAHAPPDSIPHTLSPPARRSPLGPMESHRDLCR